MKRISIITLSFCFLLACFSLWFLPYAPALPYFPMLLILLGCNLALSIYRKNSYFILWAYLLGFCWCYFEASQLINNRLPHSLENTPIIIQGEILSLPEATDTTTHFEFRIDNIFSIDDCKIYAQQYQCQRKKTPQWATPQKIRLSWYHNHPSLHIGDEWYFTVKLKAPRSTYNPASFDYEAWLMAHRITATGYIVDKFPTQLLANHAWHRVFDQWRQSLQQKMNLALANYLYAGMVEALAIGVRDQITPEQWQIMQATGINHLMAIAGLHLGFVISFIYWLAKWIFRLYPKIFLWRPAHEIALFVALIAGIFYSALAGFSLPTQRALVMMTVALSTQLLRRQISPWQSYWLALLAVLIYDPLSIFSESFWLSFVAVAVILFAILGRRRHSGLMQLAYLQWVIFLGLAPITLLFFHQLSLINFIANSIAIPWVAFISLPLTLSGILLSPFAITLANTLWLLAAKSLSLLWPILQWLASLDRLQWHCYLNSSWQTICAMIGVLLIFAPKGWPQRYLGMFGFLPLIFQAPIHYPEGSFQLRLLDVGQGLSALVQTAHHTLIYDTGLKLDDSFDMGQSVVVPALQQLQIKHADKMLISHRDNDHSGGSMAVLQHIGVTETLTSAPELYQSLPAFLPQHDINQKIHWSWLQWLTWHLQQHQPKPLLTECHNGQHWNWDGVSFTIMNPDIDYNPPKNNDRSCVLMIDNGSHRLLLTGDIEKKTEQRLVKNFPASSLKADVIVAPHHGSKTSSSQIFIEAVRPQWVLYPTGYLNKFHFPNLDVIQRYRQLNAQALNTAYAGQILIYFPETPSALQTLATRQNDRKFWRFDR